MEPQEIRVLLPCHSLDDFPTHHEGRDARSLLTAWTAPWHPALIALTGRRPAWGRADDDAQAVENTVFLAPTVSRSQLSGQLQRRIQNAGAALVFVESGRTEVLAELAAAFPPQVFDSAAAAALVDDFFALGFAYLQVELLTRQMRYSSNLDEERLDVELIAAAGHAVAGEESACRHRLQAAFDLLAQERDLYYSVDAYVLDLTVVGPAHLPDAVLRQLQLPHPTSLWLMPEALGAWEAAGETLNEPVRRGLADGRLSVLGGAAPEGPALLAPGELALEWAGRAEAWQREQFGAAGRVFAQRRFGLAPHWPQILERLGFQGALHFALDEGGYPAGSQAKIRWESPDGGGVEAMARTPLDGADDGALLRWSHTLGESMDMDHVAVLAVAHWPDSGCEAYRDLIRGMQYGAALGRLATCDQFFAESDMAPHSDRHRADKYASPWLQQDVQRETADPISRTVRLWRDHLDRRAQQALAVLEHCLGGARGTVSPPAAATPPSGFTPDMIWPSQQDVQQRQQALAEAARALAPRLAGPDAAPGWLWLNPHSHACQARGVVPTLTAAADLLADARDQGDVAVTGRVPGGGFRWIGAEQPSPIVPPKGPRLAEGLILRNEFFEAQVHPDHGGLKSLHDYHQRGNRCSQRLGVRHPSSSREPAEYSEMRADSVRVVSNNHVEAQIEAVGSLWRQGRKEAEFKQLWRVWRGSPLLFLEIELDLDASQLPADPWNHYLGARFAWPDPGASLYRLVGGQRNPAESKRLEAPLCLEVDNGSQRMALLTCGLPYHRRVALNELDSLLVVRGETCRTFQVAIGLDLPRTAQIAEQVLSPPLLVAAPRPATDEGWLLHCDSRSTVVSHWEPLADAAEGLAGVRLRVQESGGRAQRLKLLGPRPIVQASLTDFRGQAWGNCRLEEGAACWEQAAHQWLQVEAYWSDART